MSETIDIYKEVSLPAIALRGVVAFPGVQTSIEIVRTASLKAFTAAATVHDAKIILVAQKDLSVEEPKEKVSGPEPETEPEAAKEPKEAREQKKNPKQKRNRIQKGSQKQNQPAAEQRKNI